MSIIKTLLERQSPSTLVARSGEVALYYDRGCYWLYSGGNAIQSVFNQAAPGELVLAYQKDMLMALALGQAMPQCVLNLGLGIGAFERCFATLKSPPKKWQAVEHNKALIALVNQQIPLGDAWPIAYEDALCFIQGEHGSALYDLILVDLFCGQHHADCIEHPDFFALLTKRLNPGGVVSLNLAPRSSEHLIALLARAKQWFNGGLMGSSEGSANIVLLLSLKPQRPLNDYLSQALRLNAFHALNFEQRLAKMHPIYPSV